MTDTTTAGTMNHEDTFAELGAMALGALSSEEQRTVMSHVADCNVCTGELARLRAVVSAMPDNPSAGPMTAQRSVALRARIVEQAGSSRAGASRPLSVGRQMSTWLALAATVAFVFSGAGYYRAAGERDRLRVAAVHNDSLIARLTSVALDREAQLAMMTGPGVHVMELAATGVHAPTARMFWDPRTNRWAMFAHGMAMPAKGRAYELWIITKDRKIPAGMFMPGSDGSAAMHTTYAMTPSDLKAIAITEEPEAGVTAPTGPIVLVGTAGA